MGQPLRATLEVPNISADQAASLQIRVANPDRFAAASMVLNSVLNDAAFELLPLNNGQSSIRIQTSRPVTEPFLDLVLEFQWGGGQQIRTYTLLLDPPNLQQTTPQGSVSVLTPALNAEAAAAPQFEPLQPLQPLPQATPPVVDQTPADSGLVRELPPASSAPIETPLVRERLNLPDPVPSNLVREVPEPSPQPEPAATVTTASPEAPPPEPLTETTTVRVVRGDTASRIALKHIPPGISLDQMLVAMLQANPRAFIDGNVNLIRAGARVNLPDFEAASQVSPQQARQMVRAQTNDFNEYRRRLAAAAPAQTTPEADQRIAGEVQEQVEVASPMATEADRLEVSRGSVSEQSASEALAQQMQQSETDDRLDELSRNLQELEALTQVAASDAPSEDGTNPAEAANTETPNVLAIEATPPSVEANTNDAADVATTEVDAAQKAESMVQRWLSNPWTVPLALLLIAVLAILGWSRAIALRKQAAFQNTAKTPAAPQMEPEAASARPSLPEGLNAPDGTDPLSEAEVYLAYGMDEQAENLLRQALAVNPNGLQERLKLLEVYQSRQDVLAFNTLAQEVFELTLGETEDWEQVARAGIKLDPGNPLYHPVHDSYNVAGELPPDVKDLSLDLGGLDSNPDHHKRQS